MLLAGLDHGASKVIGIESGEVPAGRKEED